MYNFICKSYPFCLILRCEIITTIFSTTKNKKMSTKNKRRGRKPLPISEKLVQVWTRVPTGDVVEVEKHGHTAPEYLAAAFQEKMQRDGLLQQ